MNFHFISNEFNPQYQSTYKIHIKHNDLIRQLSFGFGIILSNDVILTVKKVKGIYMGNSGGEKPSSIKDQNEQAENNYRELYCSLMFPC